MRFACLATPIYQTVEGEGKVGMMLASGEENPTGAFRQPETNSVGRTTFSSCLNWAGLR